ncbi:ELKS/Rab6-interacting/CAST family member 1-like [Alosa pseudoharengus]|uniref:ELKS/Rab6-interacting/CAST family member 1-like n=1 Tax=Alosa pseudoharengus TaxID=34774 RepID=UPI003F8AA2FF
MYGSARSVSKLEGAHSAGGGVGGGSGQSPGRSPRLPRSPRLGHRRTNSSGGAGGGMGGGGKTLSMENIQSLNAAYATSGPLYLSDSQTHAHAHHAHTLPDTSASAADLPKSSVTLGRSAGGGSSGVGGRAVGYGGRGAVAMGSSPNIASATTSDAIAFGDHHASSTVPHSLRQARDNAVQDLQAQLKEVLRENELLRRDAEAKESKLSSSMNSIKTFWSPELKKERALRKDEMAKMTVWKEQYRVMQDEAQVGVANT